PTRWDSTFMCRETPSRRRCDGSIATVSWSTIGTRCWKRLIDIHSHLLPGLDDGAQTWEESCRMARIAVADGVRVMVATPHMMWDGVFRNRAPEVLDLVE